MLILLHSSKAMRSDPMSGLRAPQLLERARELDAHLKTLSAAKLGRVMKLSPELAKKTHALIAGWGSAGKQTAAIDSFIGDIYSGLQAPSLTASDRGYADKCLRILSGLYGVLRPLDGISPYRLEMGYRLPDFQTPSLYKFWGGAIAETLPKSGPVVNLAAVEYSDTVTPYLAANRIVTPKFMTKSPKTGEPAFVTVHAKVARGAFAHWLIVNRVADVSKLTEFDEIGYRYAKKLSKPEAPVFVCSVFGGTGLSIRLQDKED